MEDTVCISLVIDDYQDERFKIRRIKDVDRICAFLVEKYNIDEKVKERLNKEIKEYIAKIRKKKYMLTIREKELVKRLYEKGIIRLKAHEEKIENIKELIKEEEFKTLSFSPRINAKASNYERRMNTLSISDFNSVYDKYNKKKVIKENIEMQRIRKKNNEIDKCKQFISFKELKQKAEIKPKGLRYENLSIQTLNEITIKGDRLHQSLRHFYSDIDLKLNTTDYKKYLHQNDNNSSTFSFKTINRCQSVKNQNKHVRDSVRLSRITFDNLYEIKENEIVDSELKNKDLIDETSSYELSNIKNKTQSEVSTFDSRKTTIEKVNNGNDSKIQKYKKRLKEIDNSMPSAFKHIIYKGKMQQMKKEYKIKNYIHSEFSFSPRINKSKSKKDINGLNRLTFANSNSSNTITRSNSLYFTFKYFPTKSTANTLNTQNVDTKKKKNSIPIEEYEERLKSIQKDIITNIYEKIKNSNNPIDVIKNDSTIDSNFKSKIILPVIEQISKQNLELNFHNFYLLCSELLVYVNI